MHARHRVFEIVKLQFKCHGACHLHSTVPCCLPLAQHGAMLLATCTAQCHAACHLHSTVPCCLPLAQHSAMLLATCTAQCHAACHLHSTVAVTHVAPLPLPPAGSVLTQMSHHHVAVRYLDSTSTAEGPQGSDCPVTFPSSGNLQYICHRSTDTLF